MIEIEEGRIRMLDTANGWRGFVCLSVTKTRPIWKVRYEKERWKEKKKVNWEEFKKKNYDSSQEEHQFSIINIRHSQTFYENRLELHWNFLRIFQTRFYQSYCSQI